MITQPNYPLYIVSKGRSDTRFTAKALHSMGVPYHIVVEEQEREAYEAVIEGGQVLVLPDRYKDEYELLDEHGRTKSTGPGPARNFAWDHSVQTYGAKRHWVMDDNIRSFHRYNKNTTIACGNGTPFRAMEDFCDRYSNVAMAGPNYVMFVPDIGKFPPFVANTRIYSCNLILNDAPYRWRGRYNEDTILSLDMLMDGWCTIQFNAFLQLKINTQKVKGGNTAEFYAKEGTTAKSIMQVNTYPRVSKLSERFGRIHHHVDYRPFKRNRLKRLAPLEAFEGQSDKYSCTLRRRDTPKGGEQ